MKFLLILFLFNIISNVFAGDIDVSWFDQGFSQDSFYVEEAIDYDDGFGSKTKSFTF